jgi:hypothetical protein
LSRANPIVLGGIEPHGHEFEIGDDVVEFDAHGAGDDVVHAQFLAGIRPPANGGGFSFAHFGEAVGIEAAKFPGDVEVAQEGVAGELRRRGVGVTGLADGLFQSAGGISLLSTGRGEPVNAFLHPRIGTARSEGGQFGGADEFSDDCGCIGSGGSRRDEAIDQG